MCYNLLTEKDPSELIISIKDGFFSYNLEIFLNYLKVF